MRQHTFYNSTQMKIRQYYFQRVQTHSKFFDENRLKYNDASLKYNDDFNCGQLKKEIQKKEDYSGNE